MHDIHASDVDLNLLVALDALLSERSVSRAATRLGLTQSAMSHRLRRLRERFGDELLVGGRAGMVPTPRAQKLAEPIRRGLLELGQVLREPEVFDPAKSQRRFTTLSADYAEIVVAPRMLERMGVEAPHVSVVLRPAEGDVFERLANGAADLYVGPPLPDPRLVRTHVAKETSVVIARADHPEIGDTLDLRTFSRLGHVVVTPVGETSYSDELLAQRGVTRRVVLRITGFAGAPFVVARSNFIACLPRAVANTAAAHLPLRVYESPVDFGRFPIDAMWHERNNDDEGHRWLRNLSVEVTRAAMVDGRVAAPTAKTKRRAGRR